MNTLSAGWRSKDKEGVVSNFYSHLNLFFIILSKIDEEIKEELFHKLVNELENSSVSSLNELDTLIFELIKKFNLPPTLSFSLLTFEDKLSYLKTVGNGVIFIKRKNKIERLIENDHSASGYLKEGDMFVLTTNELVKKIGEDRLKIALKKETPQEVIDELMPILGILNGFAGTILVVKFVSEKKDSYIKEKLSKLHKLPLRFNKKSTLTAIVTIVLLLASLRAIKVLKKRNNRAPSPSASPTKAITKAPPKEDKLEEFFDLSLLNKDITLRDVYFYDNHIYMLTNTPFIYELSTEDKAVTRYRSDLFKNAEFITANRDGIFVVVKGKGIYKVGKDKTVSLIQKYSDTWGKITDFASYGGNIYLLSNNNIYKFTPVTELEYSTALPYFKSEVNFSNAKSFAIDKYIYVAFPKKVNKYLSGKKQKFSLSDLGEKYNIDRIFTNKDLKFVYVLDKEENKVYVLNKEGELQSTLYSKAIEQAIKIANNGEKTFVFFKTKIYSFVK